MKPYHLIIALLVFSTLYYGCKPEYVNPQVAPENSEPKNISQNQDSSGPSDTSTYTVNPAPLLGKWELVKDSTSSQVGGGTTRYLVYLGTTDDYFDFRSDGKCYINEKGVLDTMLFKMPTDNSVIFGKSNGYQVSSTGVWAPIQTLANSIDPFTDRSATITYSYLKGPGGIFSRTVYLKK